jgi:chromosome segregation ATPase
MADNSAALGAARRRDGETKRRQATEALEAMVSAGEPISFPAVARRATVSVTLLYADPALASRVAEARDRQRLAGRDRAWWIPSRALVTEQSLRTDVANAKEQVRRLTEEVGLLRERLARDLGAEADIARGRMTSPLLDQLEERAAELEAANSSLRRRVAELENETHDLAEDLQAARTMNRELMSELNRSSSDDAVGPGEAHPGPRSRPPVARQQRHPAPR